MKRSVAPEGPRTARLEYFGHGGIVHGGVGGGQGEQLQQRGLVAGELREFRGGVFQAGIADHAGDLM